MRRASVGKESQDLMRVRFEEMLPRLSLSARAAKGKVEGALQKIDGSASDIEQPRHVDVRARTVFVDLMAGDERQAAIRRVERATGAWRVVAVICGEAAASAVHDPDVPAHIVVNADKPSLLDSIRTRRTVTAGVSCGYAPLAAMSSRAQPPSHARLIQPSTMPVIAMPSPRRCPCLVCLRAANPRNRPTMPRIPHDTKPRMPRTIEATARPQVVPASRGGMPPGGVAGLGVARRKLSSGRMAAPYRAAVVA